MQKQLRLLFLFIIVLSSVAYSKDVNSDVLLRSIAEVESHSVSSRVGLHNERSKYQFIASTWVMYSRVAFSQIGRPEHQQEVERVAKRHIETIKTILTQRGMEITPYSIALAWNGGPSKKHYLPQSRDYAARVNNLYNSGPASM